MFNKKKIKELENEINKINQRQEDFFKHIIEIMKSLQDSSKAKYMYELQQQDIELIKDGEKFRKIRKIIT